MTAPNNSPHKPKLNFETRKDDTFWTPPSQRNQKPFVPPTTPAKKSELFRNSKDEESDFRDMRILEGVARLIKMSEDPNREIPITEADLSTTYENAAKKTGLSVDKVKELARSYLEEEEGAEGSETQETPNI